MRCRVEGEVTSHISRRGKANNCLRATQNSRLTLMDWWWRSGGGRMAKNQTHLATCDAMFNKSHRECLLALLAPSSHSFTARWRKSLHRYYYFISWSLHKNSSRFRPQHTAPALPTTSGACEWGQQQNYCKSRRGKLLWCISKWRIVGGCSKKT